MKAVWNSNLVTEMKKWTAWYHSTDALERCFYLSNQKKFCFEDIPSFSKSNRQTRIVLQTGCSFKIIQDKT